MTRSLPRAARALLSLAAVVGAMLAPAARAVESPGATPPVAKIRIGLIAPLSGPSADFGASTLHGAELAVEEVNAIGGYLGKPLELVVRDDRGDPAAGRIAAIDLLSHENLAATIGFCNTGVAMNALDLFEAHKQVLIVPCAQGTAVTHRTPAASSFVFRVAPSDAMNAEFLVGEIVDRRQFTRVAILADTTGYGDGGVADITAQLKKRGLAPVNVGRFAAGAPSLRNELEAARAAGAQALVVYTVGPGEAAAVTARAAMHWDVAYFAPWTLSFHGVLEAAGANALEGTMMTQSVIQDFANDSRASFIARYAKATAHRPVGSLMAAAQAYDSVHLLLRAVFAAHGELSGPALKSALENPTEPYRGVVTTYEHPFSAADHDAFSVNMIWLGVWHAGELHYFYANDARLSAAVRHKQEH
jgi:branched-chain amino acid transport system substrate-binding protein